MPYIEQTHLLTIFAGLVLLALPGFAFWLFRVILFHLPLLLAVIGFALLKILFGLRFEVHVSSDTGDMELASGVRQVEAVCGCRHIEVFGIFAGRKSVVRLHYGRCRAKSDETPA